MYLFSLSITMDNFLEDTKYEFNPGPDPSLFFFDVPRTVLYFYVLRKRVF
jgi:hypothetical protein